VRTALNGSGAEPGAIARIDDLCAGRFRRLFIAKEIGGDSVDLVALLTVHARAVIDHAARMLAEGAEDSAS